MNEKPFKEDFQRHHNRRKRGHDYMAPWKYHITICKASGCPDFSKIVINELTPEGVGVKDTRLGAIITKAIWDFLKWMKDYASSNIRLCRIMCIL